MKKNFFVFLVAVLVTMAAFAENELISASWDFIGDSVSAEYATLQNEMIAGKTLSQNGISLFYYGEDFSEKPLEPNAEQGMYWRRSNKTDRAIVLTVPGSSKALVKYAVRPAKTNNDYRFYIFAQQAGTDAPTMHGNQENALISLDWKYAVYTVDTISFEIDLTERQDAQDIYLVFEDLGGPNKKDMRLRGVSYQMTEKKGSTTTSTEEATIAGKAASKMIINGQLVIVCDGVEYNAMGEVL